MSDDLQWVFGYGSLIWRPGFEFAAREPALLHGAHRQLCIYSFTHRGTPETPGLVLGLERGGSCRGVAFAVRQSDWPPVLDYLRARELQNNVYHERWRPIRLASGVTVPALTYLADPAHIQYAGHLPREEQLRLVRQGHGNAGPNRDYVINTAAHLSELGLKDPTLEWLSRKLAE
ncbi:gamma-glutamylcyclotransferase [Cucumibacter marinus]|uniref:gamma-glutamylcyclotransferase n=1 Tax=Cucumibacter marinus TaxID=1121252 RepID=UPI00048D5649|nr:gamma-glutamylcyclotransferase [Cucumibacter marinus]